MKTLRWLAVFVVSIPLVCAGTFVALAGLIVGFLRIYFYIGFEAAEDYGDYLFLDKPTRERR